MEPVIIIHYGEIALKGKNRHMFIDQLKANVRYALQELEGWELRATPGRIFVEFPHDTVRRQESDDVEARTHQGLQFQLADEAVQRLQRVPGIVAVSPAVRTELSFEALERAADFAFEDALRRTDVKNPTFKVETRRPNKSFPLESPEVSKRLGARLLSATADRGVTVDVHEPDIMVEVELRQQAYVRTNSLPGPGGLPVGASGRVLVLLSGGIDSPVAAWLALKRGMEVQAVHFHSHPFTSERSLEKVKDICAVLAPCAAGTLKLHVVHFTEIQKLLQSDGPPELLTILMRRSMMRIATRVAEHVEALALVTGESVGQVASQTLESLQVTNAATDLPVLQPVITYDKNEIIDVARTLGTYDISIRPYEDCCALFVPRQPKTRPRLNPVRELEAPLQLAALEQEAAESVQTLTY